MNRLIMITVMMGMFFASDALRVNGEQADDVRGTYWNAEKTAKIRIYRAKNGKYYGKIEHLTEPNNDKGTPKLDPENPDPKLRSQARLGLLIMKSFEWNESENKWEDGTIYDPASGKLYDAYMNFENGNKNILKLRGYVMGMTWLGKTSDWERID